MRFMSCLKQLFIVIKIQSVSNIANSFEGKQALIFVLMVYLTAPSLRVPVGICRVVRTWVGVVVKMGISPRASEMKASSRGLMSCSLVIFSRSGAKG